MSESHRTEDEMSDQEKRKKLARDLAEFQEWQNRAEERGWKLPGASPLPNSAWLAYWKGMDAYERDPKSRGRPVIPHRSGHSAPAPERPLPIYIPGDKR